MDGGRYSRPERDLGWQGVGTRGQQVRTFASYHMDTDLMGVRTSKMGLAQIWQCPSSRKAIIVDSGRAQNAMRTKELLKLLQSEPVPLRSWSSSIGYTAISPPALSDPDPAPPLQLLLLARLSRVSNRSPTHSMCFYPTHCSNHHYVSGYVSLCKVSIKCILTVLLIFCLY